MSNLQPHPLLDAVKSEFGLDTDADLCRFLAVFPYPISRIRRGKMPVGRSMMISIHEKTEWPLSRIKELVQVKA
jgi:hypothetical protein